MLGLNAAWLEDRFALFERFCFPSVCAQTESRFTWLVYFDAATPRCWFDRIDRFRSLAAFQPILISQFDIQTVQETVRPYITPGRSHLITSRLDNDDAICRSFIEDVQRQVDGEEVTIINFNRGCVWKSSRVYVYDYVSNPFVSMIERKAISYRTVFEKDHNKFADDPRLRCIMGSPSWLQTVHGANLSNGVRGRRVFRESFLREGRFAIYPDLSQESETTLEILLDSWRAVPLLCGLASKARWLLSNSWSSRSLR